MDRKEKKRNRKILIKTVLTYFLPSFASIAFLEEIAVMAEVPIGYVNNAFSKVKIFK